MISRIFRPIRDGFKGVGRHASMSIQSASAVTLALIIISLFLMFSMTVQNFTKGIEESVSISEKERKDDRFDVFWKAYPKKVGKEAARKAFRKVREAR